MKTRVLKNIIRSVATPRIVRAWARNALTIHLLKQLKWLDYGK